MSDCDDELDNEVSVLSYENALRTHAGYKPDEFDDSRYAEPYQSAQSVPFEPMSPPAGSSSETSGPSASAADSTPTASLEFQRNLKSASITIRLSQVECTQLRARAAEAGLTVSAYLRSCTFEADSLRALVKDALAKLQANASRESPPVSGGRNRFVQWLVRIWPPKQKQLNHFIARS